MQEPTLSDPPLLVDQRALHDGDLARRTSEGLQGDGEPGARRLPERERVRVRHMLRHSAGLLFALHWEMMQEPPTAHSPRSSRGQR